MHELSSAQYRAFFFDQEHMRLTKDRKNGCAYDPGVLDRNTS